MTALREHYEALRSITALTLLTGVVIAVGAAVDRSARSQTFEAPVEVVGPPGFAFATVPELAWVVLALTIIGVVVLEVLRSEGGL